MGWEWLLAALMLPSHLPHYLLPSPLCIVCPAPPRPGLPRPALQTIVRRMGAELDRFQRERAQEVGYVLRDFATVEARLSGDTARLWGSLLPKLGAGGQGSSNGAAVGSSGTQPA